MRKQTDLILSTEKDLCKQKLLKEKEWASAFNKEFRVKDSKLDLENPPNATS